MRHEQYYIIKPSPNLLRALEAFDDDIAEILRETELWINYEGGVIRGITLDEYENQNKMRVKLLWWMYLKQEFGKYPTYQAVLGNQIITVERFDYWWILESYQASENVPGIEQWIRPENVNGVESTHPDILEWLEHLKAGHLQYVPPESPPQKTHNRPLRLPKASKDENKPQS
jgi:hypothetical protein